AWREGSADIAPAELRDIAEVCDELPPLDDDWRALVEFAAGYYQRSVGEVALAVLPPELRRLGRDAIADRIRRMRRAVERGDGGGVATNEAPPTLTAEQATASEAIAAAMASSAP